MSAQTYNRGQKLTAEEAESIISRGAYYVLTDFASKAAIHATFVQTLLEGVEKLESRACRDKVEADGLGQIHRHFPIAKIHLLEAHLMEHLQDELYYWSYRVGADTVGLKEPFYIDHLIVFRIHYPFELARKGKDFVQPPYPLKDRLRFATAALTNPGIVTNLLVHRRKTAAERNAHLAAFAPQKYHGPIPEAARSHGPHIDTWYGHSYDGMNLWMAIEGVNDDNTVILYPEMFARPVDFDPENMYLRPGIQLPDPLEVKFGPGDLLVFNPELLHATQVNISNETRIAFTTRINPGRPRFAPKAPFHFDHWYSSADLKQRKFNRIKAFPIPKNQGKPSVQMREPYVDPKTRRITLDKALPKTGALAVCAAKDLKVGEKLAVDLTNAKIIVWRGKDGLKAYSRACPHLGIDVVDGSHTDKELFCPGHGIGFQWKDGASHCATFKLLAYAVSEADGQIQVASAKAATAKKKAGEPA